MEQPFGKVPFSSQIINQIFKILCIFGATTVTKLVIITLVPGKPRNLKAPIVIIREVSAQILGNISYNIKHAGV